MTTPNERSAHLTIAVAPELRQRLQAAAAAHQLSLPEYIETVLQQALAVEERDTAATEAERADWSRLSARSFARDWDSEEDAVYDRRA